MVVSFSFAKGDGHMLLRDLLEELAQVDQPVRLFTEEEETSFDHEDFHVVGTVPLELQKVLTIHRKCEEKIQKQRQQNVRDAVAGDFNVVSIGHSLNEAEKSLAPLKLRAMAIKELFWASVRLEFPELIGKNNIRLGPGWQVGWVKSEEGVSAAEIFGLMGLLSPLI